MPTFEVQTDSGTFHIEAPDQNAALSALSSLPSGPSNSVAGSAKAIGSGLVEGAIGLAGLPADAVDLGTQGVDYLAGTQTNKAVAPLKRFGSENIKKGVEGYTGELPKPGTDTEKYLHSIAGMAPAMIGGGGSLLTRIGTRMVAPGVASEAAGQAAEGTGYEPAARVAGALGGAVAGSKLAGAINAPKAAAVPTIEEVGNAKTAGYNGPATKALEINPTYAVKVSDKIADDLGRARFSQKDPATATVYGLVDDLKNPEFGATHRLADFDNTRRRLNEVAGGTGSGAEAARQAIRTIDAATLRIPQTYVVAGDAKAASKELFDARKNASVEFRDKKIAEVLEKASNTASATHSGGNLENEIYKQVRSMLNNPKALRGWTAEEKDALRAVLPGHMAGGLRRAGKVMGGGGGLGQLASGAAGSAMFGPAGMFALPALGLIANKAGSALATKRLGSVSEQLRSRSPLYSPANRSQRQALLSGGIFAGLPKREQLALQGLLAAQTQPQLPNYARQ